MLLTLFIMQCSTLFARAGGGGSGSFSSFYHTRGKPSLLSFLLTVIVLLGCVISFVMYFKETFYRRNLKKECNLYLEKIKEKDPVWDIGKISEHVKVMFFDLQAAWMHKDEIVIKCYLSSRLCKDWCTQLQRMRSHKESNVLENIRLLSYEPFCITKLNQVSTDSIIFCIKGKMKDYTIDETNQKRIRGIRRNLSFIEYWKLIRIKDEWYLDCIFQRKEIKHHKMNHVSKQWL